jgi:hypothetical protein
VKVTNAKPKSIAILQIVGLSGWSGWHGLIWRWQGGWLGFASKHESLTEYLWFEVPDRRGYLNATATVEEMVRKSEVKEGLCLVNARHITASVHINDVEDGLLHDCDVWLEKLAPHEPTSNIITTGPAKITRMHISNGRSWVARWWLRLPKALSIWSLGSRASMGNSTVIVASEYGLRLLENRLILG